MFMIYKYANYLDAPELSNIYSKRICGNRRIVGIADNIEGAMSQIRSKALFEYNSLRILYNILSEGDIKYSDQLQYVINDLINLYSRRYNDIHYDVKFIIKRPINGDNDKTIIIAKKAPAYNVLFEIVQFKNYKDLIDKVYGKKKY